MTNYIVRVVSKNGVIGYYGPFHSEHEADVWIMYYVSTSAQTYLEILNPTI